MNETMRRGIIEVGVDASGVKTGIADANKAISSLGQHASSAADAAGSSIQGIGSSAGDASKKIEQETRRIINSIQRQIAQTEAGERGTAKYYAAMANQKGVPAAVLEPYIKQLDQVTQKQNMARAAAAALDPQVQKLGMSHKQLSFAMRQVPMQFTDIAVGLATGQRPLMVMLQQGGQLKDLFGGIVPAAKALGSYVLRLVNPFTLAAAALGGLAYAYYEGASESERLNKALIATGNSAGTTANDMTKLAGKIGDTAKAYGTAREAAEALAGSGRFTASQLEPAMRALTYGAEVTGSKISDLVTEMENIAGKPTEAIIKLNEKYNFLTKDIYEQIKALEKSGQMHEAARIAFEAYANAMEGRKKDIQENLGFIEQGWKDIKSAISAATDAALSFGRASDPLKEIDRLQKDIAEMEQSGNPHVEEYLAASKAKLQSLRAEQEALAKTTAEQAKQNQATKDYIKIDQENEKKKKKKSRKSPEETAYERLISSIKQKIEANDLEILTGQALTEAQKMQIKYQSDLATGRIKLTAAQKESTQALLDELSAIEQKNIYSRSAIEYDREFQRVMRDMVNDYNLQIDIIGKTAQEVEKLTTATHILRKAEEMVSRGRERGVIDDSLADRILADARRQADTAQNMIDQRYAKENDPWVGLTESVKRYGEEAGKQGEQIGNAFNNAMSSAEDAWVEFMTTGKISFKGLANSIIADLARMQFQSMAKNLFGGLFGGSGSTSSGGGFDFGSILSSIGGLFGTRALGGPVTAGTPYLVGEEGPELFMPSVSGSIATNDATTGTSVNFSPTINIDSRSDRAQVMADTERMLRQSQAQLIDKLERQGRLN